MIVGTLTRRAPQLWLAGTVLAAAAFAFLIWTAPDVGAQTCPQPPNYQTEAGLAGSPIGCRDMVFDPGQNQLMSRSDLWAQRATFTSQPKVGFSNNFLWYSIEKTIRITDPNVEWTSCATVPGPGNPCPVPNIKDQNTPSFFNPVLYVFGFPSHVDLNVFEWDGVWIAKVCGNYLQTDRRPVPIPTITGQKFHDIDRDGVRDGNEPWLSGWQFRITRTDSLVGQPDASWIVATNSAGRFTLDLLERGPGRYVVEEIQQSGWVGTNSLTRVVNVGFGVGDRAFDVGDFGNTREADVAKTDMQIVAPPAEFDVATDTDLTVRVDLTNHGPAGPVAVEDTVTATAPVDCTVTPATRTIATTLAAGQTKSFDVVFTVNCALPSFHEFVFDDELRITTTGVFDPDPSNNARSVATVIPVIAESDLAVQVPQLDCTDQVEVDTTFACSLTGTVANLGPYGPTEATASFALAVPPDCVAAPDGPLSVIAGDLAANSSAAVARAWVVSCSERSFHEFTGTIATAPTDIHIRDLDPANDSGTATDTTEVFEDAELVATDIAVFCDEVVGEGPFTCMADVTVTNAGPAPDVAAVVTAEILGSSECAFSPAAEQTEAVVLDVGDQHVAMFSWGVSCAPSDVLHPFTFVADVAPDATEPHAVDEPGPIDIVWVVPYCIETINPHGKTEPQAPGTGQNEDGFYEFGTLPEELGNEVWVRDTGSGTLFGPFPSGTDIKYVEANGAEPSITAMGGNNGDGNGQAEAVEYQIRGTGDAAAVFFDMAGNEIATLCRVPPKPK